VRLRKKTLILAIIVIIIVIIPITSVSVGDMMFRSQVEQEIEDLFASSGNISDNIFTPDQSEGLPEPVQRYLRYSLDEGQNYISYVRLKHGGTIRQSTEQGWMPVSGEEYITAQRPGFVWVAKLSSSPLFWLAAKDIYIEGKGDFQIKLLSLITVADAKGKEIDEGELMRWLAEVVWFPTALLPSEHLRWEAIDSNSARAILTSDGFEINVTFVFNEKGEITQLIGDRYAPVEGGSYQRQRWLVYYSDYQKIDGGGINIPYQLEAAWGNSQDVEFTYARFRITDIEFNNPTRY
jgi:hypothetical protein